MITIIIKLKELPNKDLDVRMYDDADSVKHSDNEMLVTEDIYDLIAEYLYGEEVDETVNGIIDTMRKQSDGKN